MIIQMVSRMTKVPETDLKEFAGGQTRLVKTRVRLFCILTLALYLGANILSVWLFPGTYRTEETPFIIAMIIFAALIIFLTGKARSFGAAKMNAYLFTVFMLGFLTKVNLIYPEYLDSSSSIYLFFLFLVTFTIPWYGFEVIPLAFTHLAAYVFLYFYVQNYEAASVASDFEMVDFIGGVIFIFMGFILCLVVRSRETFRDIQNFLFLKEIARKNVQMQKELELATRIHKTLIPRSISTDRVDVAVMYLPMSYIGGDYAKFRFLDKDRLVFMICDVTGHGVSSALLVNRIHSEFERLSKDLDQPASLLDGLNDFILADFSETGMFLTAFCCLLDFGNMKLSYSNHGHPPQYIYRVGETGIKRLDPEDPILGIPFIKETSSQKELDFSEGDKMMLFTDGVIEAKDPGGKEYGIKRLEDFISSKHSYPADTFNHSLVEELKGFNRSEFEDDVFIVTVDIKR